MKTLEERERLAYISGRVEEAAVLADAIDPVDDRILDLDWELRQRESEVEDLERQLQECTCGR